MAAADQIKSLIRSFGEGDDARFYATAMQIAAAEARSGHTVLAEELKKLIDKAKQGKISTTGIVRNMPLKAGPQELHDLLEMLHPQEKMHQMVLNPVVKSMLSRILDEQRKMELLQQHNLLPRKKLLFTGPPGCGKTMSAKMLAGELGLPLFVIRLDGLLSRYMGESISKLRLIFEAMHQLRAVYLFDEFDSIGSTRQNTNDTGEIKRVLNTFLLQIEKDDSNSLIVAATNLPGTLDEALFRRFDDIISFPPPNLQEITELYRRELATIRLSLFFPLAAIAEKSQGLSFAEIHRICEDIKKHILIYGEPEISTDKLLDFVRHRKKPFQT